MKMTSALEEQNESNELSKYVSDYGLPFENLEQLNTITIEQFVNELKSRKKAKQKIKENQAKASLNKPPVDNRNKMGKYGSKKDKTLKK